VPSMIHGQEIDVIEFYLTNQDQQIQDLQRRQRVAAP